MNREHLEELAALDALDALDGDDVTSWREASAKDPVAVRLRDEFADVAARLSLLAAETPAPSALRSRVMDAVFGAPTGAANQTEHAETSSLWSSWAAAAAVLLLALLGIRETTERRESVVVRDARPDAGAPYVALDGYGDFSGAKASVVWDSGQRGWWIQAGGLPSLPATHCYRVWAIGDREGEIFDCGELPAANGHARVFLRPDAGVTSMRGFAVSIETAGKKPRSPGTPMVLITPALRG